MNNTLFYIHSTSIFVFDSWIQGLCIQPRQTLNLPFLCLSLLTAGIIGVCCHSWLNALHFIHPSLDGPLGGFSHKLESQKPFFLLFQYFNYVLSLSLCVCMYRGQRTVYWTWFSSIVCVLGTKLRSVGLAAGTFIYGALSLVLLLLPTFPPWIRYSLSIFKLIYKKNKMPVDPKAPLVIFATMTSSSAISFLPHPPHFNHPFFPCVGIGAPKLHVCHGDIVLLLNWVPNGH